YDNIYQTHLPDHVESYWDQCVFEGIISVQLNGAWGLIDTNGNYRSHIIYDGLQGVSEGIVAAEVGGKTGFIDIRGGKLIPFVFDWTDKPWKNGFGTAYLIESELVLNRQGKIIASELGTEGPSSVDDLKDLESLTRLDLWFRYTMEDYGGSFDEMEFVDWMEMGLTSIPDQVSQFPNMMELNLRGNYLSSIDYDLTGFRNLESLDLSNNPLKGFPTRILEIPSL
ncbi:MAG: WG repeat-containing protein, partial [Bacteroidales bacterium]|nr:WG repeat-containing protein [Bacteroidales bacterium]